MRRAKTDLPISPKLLQHFAAATLAITFCIALFASGNSTEVVKPQLAHKAAPRHQVNLADASNKANNGLKIAPRRTMPEEDPPLQEQTLSQQSAIPILPPEALAKPALLPSDVARPEDLLPERQAALRARKHRLPRKPTAAEIAAIKEASRIRSGASTLD
ncbi:MAG: hypothetical protein ACKOW1_05185 [Novosphingobium sp.]|jgi:hypothetical protein